MGQAGLVVSHDLSVSESDSPGAMLISLSWAGHDFIEACRDNSIWEKAKDKVLKPAAGMAFDVLLEWLKAEARRRFCRWLGRQGHDSSPLVGLECH